MKTELKWKWQLRDACAKGVAPGLRRTGEVARVSALACVWLLALVTRVQGDTPFCNFYATPCPDMKDRPACEACGCPPGSGGPTSNPSVWSGTIGNGTAGQPGPTTSCATCGLAKWWVSEPQTNLRFEDEPIGYQPSRGQRMSFHLL
jgi:hypothetical protein